MLTFQTVPPVARRSAAAKPFHALVLHGLGDSLHGWKDAAGVFQLDELGWTFANAPIPYYGGFSWFTIDLGAGRPRVDLGEFAESRRLLDELIAHLLATLAIPSERLFLCGFSQGSAMVVDHALRSDRRYAGIVGISGFLPTLDDFPAAFSATGKAQQILLTHGRWDDVIPVDWARLQAERLKELGADADWREYDKPHSLDPVREIGDIRSWVRARMR
ncbi:MAG TPA: hypothetical protein VEL07_19585 [Planctomycetota bacterium]|nr:hypothetical protein [Planctomycetota bacterium]